MAKDCPEASQKPGANVIEAEPTQEVSEEHSDPWLRTVGAGGEADEVPTRGPTYSTTGPGAQVSIVRRELLPKVRGTQGWTKEQYQTRNLKLDRRPIGANGTELGVVALVKLEVSVNGTDKTLQVPCYVLNSDKPLWTVDWYLVLTVWKNLDSQSLTPRVSWLDQQQWKLLLHRTQTQQ